MGTTDKRVLGIQKSRKDTKIGTSDKRDDIFKIHFLEIILVSLEVQSVIEETISLAPPSCDCPMKTSPLKEDDLKVKVLSKEPQQTNGRL